MARAIGVVARVQTARRPRREAARRWRGLARGEDARGRAVPLVSLQRAHDPDRGDRRVGRGGRVPELPQMINPFATTAPRSLGTRVCGLCACKRGGIRHRRGVSSLARQARDPVPQS